MPSIDDNNISSGASSILGGASGGILSSALSIIEGAFANREGQSLADKLSERSVRLPSSAYEAFGLAKDNLNAGLPGREYALDAAKSAEASTINSMRKVAKSPSSLTDFAARSESQANDFFKKLAVEEADRTFANKSLFLNEAQKMTNTDLEVQKDNLGLQTEALYQGAQGKKDMLQGVENAAGKLT